MTPAATPATGEARPRIAFVTNNTYAAWGGSEELWSRAALRLHHEGVAVQASVQNWSPRPARLVELESAGVPMHTIRPVRAMRAREWARSKWRHTLPRSLLEATVEDVIGPFRPDLVVVSQMMNLDGARWASTLHARGLPYVLIAHAASAFSWPHDEAWPGAREAHRHARRSFFVSRATAEFTERQLCMELPRAEICYNPYVVRYEQTPGWPQADAPLRLACVARLDAQAKGHDLLFQVLALPRWRGRPLEIVLYGAGPNETSLRALAAYLHLDSVRFAGHTTDVEQVWKECHGLILPSRLEGMPLVLVEAMLCHRVSVVTPVGGNAELIEDGVNGFVSEAVSVAALDATLERAWQCRANWREMGLAAGRRVREIVPADPVGRFAERLVAVAGERA